MFKLVYHLAYISNVLNLKQLHPISSHSCDKPSLFQVLVDEDKLRI